MGEVYWMSVNDRQFWGYLQRVARCLSNRRHWRFALCL